MDGFLSQNNIVYLKTGEIYLPGMAYKFASPERMQICI